MADDPKPSDGADVKDDNAVLADALELHKLCVDNEADNRKLGCEDMRFAVLDDQWDEEIKKFRKDRACLTINKLRAFKNQVINDARQNTPAIRVRPVDDEADPMTAEIFNGLIRNIEQVSRADIAYDTAVEFAVVMGWGYIRVDVDYSHDDTFEQDILIKRVPNPLAVYGDPYSLEADSSDWNDAFFEDKIAKKLFKQKYKGAEAVDWSGYERLEAPWKQDEEVLVAEWWHRDEVSREIVLLSDGQVMDAAEYEVRKDLFETIGVTVQAARQTKGYKITHRVMTGAEILETESWVGRYIPIIPVYGEEINIEGKRHFRSLIRSAKDAQRMYNYWRSTEAEILQQAPRAPWIGPKGFADEDPNWRTANIQNHAYLEYSGNVGPTRQLAPGVPSGFLQAALNMADDIKSTLGMFDASLGARSNETSGKAIRERRVEGDTATFHFPDNLRRAIAHTGRVLIDLIPKIYTGQRIVRVLGQDRKTDAAIPLGQPVMAQMRPGGMPQVLGPAPPETPAMGQPDGTPAISGGISQPVQNAAGSIPQGQQPAPMRQIFDLSRGKYDLVAEAGPNFATKRQEAAEQMMELLRVFPEAAPIIGDLMAKNLDWPGADEIAERLKALLPPAALGQEDPRLAQAMQMIETLKAALGQANQQMQMMQADKSVEMAKIGTDRAKVETEKAKTEVAKFEAQTERMSVINEIVNPPPAPQPKPNGGNAVAGRA